MVTGVRYNHSGQESFPVLKPQAQHILQRGKKATLAAVLFQRGSLGSATCDGPFQSVTFVEDIPPPGLTTEFCIRMTVSFLVWLEYLGSLAELGPQPQSLIATFSTLLIVL